MNVSVLPRDGPRSMKNAYKRIGRAENSVIELRMKKLILLYGLVSHGVAKAKATWCLCRHFV